MNFHPFEFIANLKFMGLGMLGILIVMLVLIGITALLNYITRNNKD